MYHLIFTLTMPRKGSWNNKWSGEGRPYIRAKSFNKKSFEQLPDIIDKYHEYRWPDGWTAVVDVKLVTSAKEKNKLIKNSVGFYGYDWMIDSLLKYGKIIDEQKEQLNEKEKQLEEIVDKYSNKLTAYIDLNNSQNGISIKNVIDNSNKDFNDLLKDVCNIYQLPVNLVTMSFLKDAKKDRLEQSNKFLLTSKEDIRFIVNELVKSFDSFLNVYPREIVDKAFNADNFVNYNKDVRRLLFTPTTTLIKSYIDKL